MRIASRDLQVVSVGLVSAVLLAGCSGNSSKPTVLPPLTTSAAPAVATAPAPAPKASVHASQLPATAVPPSGRTPSPSPAQPTTTDTDTEAAVKTTVRKYFTVVNAAQLDASALPEWRSLFIDSCVQCLTDYNLIKKELSLGVKYVGGGYKITLLSEKPLAATSAYVALSVWLPATKAYDKSGKLIANVPTSKPRKATVSLRQESGKWLVSYYAEGQSK